MMALADALTIMGDKTLPFKIKYVSCDRNKKKGGQIKTIEKAVCRGYRHNQKNKQMRNLQDLDAPGSHFIPIHIRLIVEVNNDKVYY